MKKRLLAIIMALCVSSVNVMGAFAAAQEGTDSIAVEEVDLEAAATAEETDEETEEAGEEGSSGESETDEDTSEENSEDQGGVDGSEGSDGETSDEGASDSVMTGSGTSDSEQESAKGDDVSTGVDGEQSDSAEQEESVTEDEQSEEKGSEGTTEDGASLDDVADEGSTVVVSEELGTTDSYKAARDVVASGTCGAEGDNLTWELTGADNDLTLTISGSGRMEDYLDVATPWFDYCGGIENIDISTGVTYIGMRAFSGCSSLTSVTIPEGVTTISYETFYNCSSLSSVYIPEGVTDIGENAFLNCASPIKIYYEGSREEWDQINHSVVPDEAEIVCGKLTFFIQYVLNGGTNSPENMELFHEGDVLTFKDPSRTGYTFGGWYSDEEFSNQVTGITAEQSGDQIIYAKWVPNTYTVVFKGNTASSGTMATVSYTVGQTPSLPANTFAKKEHIFSGWNTRANGTGTGVKNKGKLDTVNAANGSTITLYAQWKIKEYKIVYNLNGGTNNKANPVTYTFKTADITLAKPTRKGFVFKGWFSDSKLKTAVTLIKKGSTGNKTVYAKWSAVKYTIQYELKGGTAPTGNPSSYYVTTADIKLKNPTKKGHTFGGWYKESSYVTKVTTIAKGSVGNLKLYAKWTPTKYKITYNLGGGTNNKANPATYTITTAKITFAKPTKKGYTFVGWYSDSQFKKQITVINKGSTGNKTVYAKWKLVNYTISYELNGGTAPAGNPRTYNVKSAITFLAPQKTGYEFKGWYGDSGYNNSITAIAKGTTGNKKLYAKWVPIEYTVVFKPNYPLSSATYTGSMDSIQCKYDKTYKLPVNQYKEASSYYVLMEWNTRADGKGKAYKDTASIKNLSSQNGATVNLYGTWMILADSVVIDYWLSTIDVPKGFTRKIGVNLYPGYSTEKVTYTSSNKSIATVTNNGVIKGVGKGKAKITATTSSGKKDSITVNVVDNCRTWGVTYNLNYYDYGEPTVAPIKMYYSGSKLIFEALVVNNRMFTADKFDYINITLYDSNGKQLVKKKFTNYKLNMGEYSYKKVTFTFDSVRKADLIDGDYDYDYWYTYSY